MGDDSLHANRHLPLTEAGFSPTETSRILIYPPLTEAGVFPTEIKRSTRMAPDAPANSDFRE